MKKHRDKDKDNRKLDRDQYLRIMKHPDIILKPAEHILSGKETYVKKAVPDCLCDRIYRCKCPQDDNRKHQQPWKESHRLRFASVHVIFPSSSDDSRGQDYLPPAV